MGTGSAAGFGGAYRSGCECRIWDSLDAQMESGFAQELAMGRRESRSGRATRWTGSGGRRWTEREGRQVLAAWKDSGLSASGFARQHGLNPQRLLWWRKQLGGWDTGEAIEPTASSTMSLIRAEVRESTTAAAGMVLRLPGGVVVEFADVNAVSPTWVASLANEVWRRS